MPASGCVCLMLLFPLQVGASDSEDEADTNEEMRRIEAVADAVNNGRSLPAALPQSAQLQVASQSFCPLHLSFASVCPHHDLHLATGAKCACPKFCAARLALSLFHCWLMSRCSAHSSFHVKPDNVNLALHFVGFVYDTRAEPCSLVSTRHSSSSAWHQHAQCGAVPMPCCASSSIIT